MGLVYYIARCAFPIPANPEGRGPNRATLSDPTLCSGSMNGNQETESRRGLGSGTVVAIQHPSGFS